MRIVVSAGSYERILYGIDIHIKDDGSATTKESFAIPAHLGYIKRVASCPKFLVSGGTDENIRIFDLKRRRDIGSLSQHQGSVTALAFVNGSTHLLTGGEDGRIGLFRTKDWECLHIFRHKRAVHSLAVHPSGKLALSAGKDRTLKLWNLMTGKQAHASSLPHEALGIYFSESGTYYGTVSDFHANIYETGTARLVTECKSETRLASGVFGGDDAFYFAGEGTAVQCVKLGEAAGGPSVALHTEQLPRIKDLAVVSQSGRNILITASSSGSIRGWDLGDKRMIFEHQSGIRLTCLTATTKP